MNSDQLRELLAIGYNGQIPFAEFVRMVDKALTAPEETAWLIEDTRGVLGRPSWWSRPGARGGDFDVDSTKAIRFSRKEDADLVAKWIKEEATERRLIVTEHLWSPVKLGSKEWKCGECGYMNTASICTKCGGIFE